MALFPLLVGRPIPNKNASLSPTSVLVLSYPLDSNTYRLITRGRSRVVFPCTAPDHLLMSYNTDGGNALTVERKLRKWLAYHSFEFVDSGVLRDLCR